MLLVPALLGAARVGRAGPAVAVLALVTVAGSRFGADGGGLIVLLAAYATLLLRTTQARLGAARLVAVAAAAVALGLVLVGVDAALGGSSHVTHAVGDGPGTLLGDLADRLEISARRTFDAFGPAFAALASLAVLIFVATRRPRGPLTDALLVGVLVSLLVNDTPGDVLGMGAVGAFVLWRYEGRAPHDAPLWRDRLRAMRRPAIVLALLVLALALGLVAAGCSEGEVGAAPNTVEGTLPEETTGGNEADLPALKLTGDATAGKAVFESAGCTACHTLSAAGSTGTVGPNLDDAKPSFDLVVQRVTLGQGGMPSFKDQLQPQQIADVAEFVSSSAGG
jgi:mono/diheme cytochrome c family protein